MFPLVAQNRAVSDILLRKFWESLPINSWKVNKADIKSVYGPRRYAESDVNDSRDSTGLGGEKLLYLTDEQLRKGIEAMFFAYRGFTADPDVILQEYDYGRAHHRAIHFIHRTPGTTVNNLLAVLGVTKQSLNRVLRRLIADGLVENRVGKRDKRERNLMLTQVGRDLEHRLSESQRSRMRTAFRAAGPQAVGGFRLVLEEMMDADLKRHFNVRTEIAK